MKLVLAGGTSHSDSYVKGLQQHESDKVRFLPWVSGENLDELLSNAAIFVLPSDLEGLSLALLDAMASSVCVLTSNIPENNEVVADSGFTFERGNLADLERVLNILVNRPDLRHQAATRQRARIQNGYLWPSVARSIEGVYLDLLGWPVAKQIKRQRTKFLPSYFADRSHFSRVSPRLKRGAQFARWGGAFASVMHRLAAVLETGSGCTNSRVAASL